MAIGGGAGAIAGALIGNETDNANAAISEQESELDARDREIEENRRMLDELRSTGLDVRDTDRGLVVNLPDVLFDFDSANLTRAAYSTTSEIANILKKSKRHALVEGHTDSIGSDQYNINLSRRRAQSVSQALESDGVSPARITTRGVGEQDPVASNDTESGRERNRRVEVIIQK
jgi:outer membrane protein OmpA-like peptidoglycan-associated protein